MHGAQQARPQLVVRVDLGARHAVGRGGVLTLQLPQPGVGLVEQVGLLARGEVEVGGVAIDPADVQARIRQGKAVGAAFHIVRPSLAREAVAGRVGQGEAIQVRRATELEGVQIVHLVAQLEV